MKPAIIEDSVPSTLNVGGRQISAQVLWTILELKANAYIEVIRNRCAVRAFCQTYLIENGCGKHVISPDGELGELESQLIECK